MKKFLISILASIFILSSLTACTNKQVGTVGGAVVGGVAGSALTQGSTAGTIGGAVAGGFIGNQLSN